MLLGLAQGHSVFAYTEDFTPTSYKILNTSYPDEKIRVVSSYPTLVETYDLGNGNYNYLFEISVNLNIRFPANTDYYCNNSTCTVNMEYPSNAGVLQTRIKEYHNSEGYNVSLYSFTTSSANHYLRAYFRIMGQDKYIYKQTSSYFYQLVSYTVQIRTDTETAPTLSFTNISSNINFTQGQSYIDSIIDAIDNSDTAEDIADILTTSGLTLSEIRGIASQFGIANEHLTYIQEYAYFIYSMLDAQLSQDTETDFAQAETKVEDLVGNLQQYQPNKPNSNQIQTDAQSRYMSMQAEEQNSNIFFYLSFQFILPIILLVFTFAILSYILYGGK